MSSTMCLAGDGYPTRIEQNPGMPRRARPKPKLNRHYLQAWRKRARLSQEKAAVVFDIDRGYLSKIENMKAPYTQPVLEAAAVLYGCSVADILSRAPSPEPDPVDAIADRLRKEPRERVRLVADVVDRILNTSS